MLKDEIAKYTPEYLKALSVPELEALSTVLYELPKPINDIRIAIGNLIAEKQKDEQADKLMKADPALAAAIARKTQNLEGTKVDSEESVNTGS